jgi:hypothetical protein
MKTERKELIYLACPYTHNAPEFMEERYKSATSAAARLIEKGHVVFSPITMTHPIDKILAKGKITLGSQYWVDFDELFMSACSKMIVLMLDGWQESEGIQREIEHFITRGKEVLYLHPTEL